MTPYAYSLALFSVCAILISGCVPTDTDTPSNAIAEVDADAAADATHPEGYCDDLSGSWQMTFRTVTTPDSIYTQAETDVPTLKVLNDTHWMFVRQTKDGDFVLARGGPYQLEDGVYTEIVGYSSLKGNVGTEYTFECQLLDDSWYHKGQVDDEVVDEIWERVVVDDEAM